jgi:hypothetical protein
MASTEALQTSSTDYEVEHSRHSDALRASVLDAALQLGLGTNGVARWLDGQPDPGTPSSPTLTLDRSATSASEESWPTSSRQTSPTIERTGKEYQSSYSSPLLVEDRSYGTTQKITIVDPDTLPRHDRGTKKLRKRRGDGYESDSGYVSDSGKKKKKDKALAALEELEKKRLKEEKREAKLRAKDEKKEAKKAKEEPGYETDSKESRFKRSKSKKVGRNHEGYETDDGYQSSASAIKKRPKFLRLGGRSKQDKEDTHPSPDPPSLATFPLPIAERFATTLGGGSRSGTPTIPTASSSLDLTSVADTASIVTIRPSASSESPSSTPIPSNVNLVDKVGSSAAYNSPSRTHSPAPGYSRPPLPSTFGSRSQSPVPSPPILRIAVSNTATPVQPLLTAVSRSASPVTPQVGTPWTPPPVSPLRIVRRGPPSPLNFPSSPVSPLNLSRSNSPALGQSSTNVPSRATSPFLYPDPDSAAQTMVTTVQPATHLSPRRASFCDIPPPSSPPSSPLPKPPTFPQEEENRGLDGRQSPLLAAGAAIQRGKMAPFPTKPLQRQTSTTSPSPQRTGQLQSSGVRFHSPPNSAQPTTSAYQTGYVARRSSDRRRSDSDVALVPGINIEEPSDGEDDDVPDIASVLSRYAYDGTEDNLYTDDLPHQPALCRRSSAELVGKLSPAQLEAWSRPRPVKAAFNPTESMYTEDTVSVYPEDGRSTMYDLDEEDIIPRRSVVDNDRSQRMRKALLGRIEAEYDPSGREREVVSPSRVSPRRSPVTHTSDPPKEGWF